MMIIMSHMLMLLVCHAFIGAQQKSNNIIPLRRQFKLLWNILCMEWNVEEKRQKQKPSSSICYLIHNTITPVSF